MPSQPYRLLLTAGIVCLLASIVLLGFFLFALNPQSNIQPPAPSQSLASPRACFASGACLELELARSNEERARGLMFRTSLASDAGMLFVFESDDIHSFWMKNALIPLDIIWLDADSRVVGFQENVPPCTTPLCPLFSINKPSRLVLETNEGFVAENRFQIGQRVSPQNIPP